MPFAKRIQDFSAAASTRLVVLPPWNFFPWFHGGKNQEATESTSLREPSVKGTKRNRGVWACGRGKLMALQQPQTGGFESWLPCDSAGWAAGPQLRTPQGRPTAQRHGVHVREGRLGHPGPKPPALCVMLFIGCQSSQPTRHKKQGSRGGEWSRGAG